MSYYDEIKDARNEWIAEHCIGKCCAICRTFTPRLDCHEMHSRARSPRQWAHPCNYLPVCRTCHSTVVVNMPLTSQLAHKLFADPDNFSLSDISRITGREIRLRDVVAAAKLLL